MRHANRRTGDIVSQLIVLLVTFSLVFGGVPVQALAEIAGAAAEQDQSSTAEPTGANQSETAIDDQDATAPDSTDEAVTDENPAADETDVANETASQEQDQGQDTSQEATESTEDEAQSGETPGELDPMEADPLDGESDELQLEVLATASSSTPTIGAGRIFSAAVKTDGSLWTWGVGNYYAGLGDSSTSSRNKPVKVMSDVASVSYGYEHGAALKRDGSLWTWGRNSSGECGTTSGALAPKKVMDDVVFVSLGHARSAAIKYDGSLWAWGSDLLSGMSGGWTDSVPVKIMDDVAYVSVGEFYTAAIKNDGTLWVWEHGTGTKLTDAIEPYRIMSDVATVSCGDSHIAAVKTDGSLWTWGSNRYGTLGDGTTTDRTSPVKVMTGVASVSCGQWNTAAVKNDGTLWTWGYNNLGQIGDGTKGTTRTKPVKVLTGVAAVAIGGSHMVAVRTDKSLWAWGYNGDGEVGDGSNTDRTKPVKVMDGVALPGSIAVTPASEIYEQAMDAYAANHANDIADGRYAIYSKVTDDRALDIEGASNADAARALIWYCHSDANQRWDIKKVGGGYVTITSASSGKVLDVYGGNPEAGAAVIQWSNKNDGSRNQKWVIEKQSDGSCKIVSAMIAEGGKHLVLDVMGGSSSAGTQGCVWWDKGNSGAVQNQRWEISVPWDLTADSFAKSHKSDLADGVYYISSALSSKLVLDVYGASRDDAAQVIVWTKNSMANEAWRVTHDSQGYVTFTNVNSGKALDVYGARAESWSRVIQWTSNDQRNQKWVAEKCSDGSYKLISALKERKLVIDVEGGVGKDGTRAIMWEDKGGTPANQRWRFTKAVPSSSLKGTYKTEFATSGSGTAPSLTVEVTSHSGSKINFTITYLGRNSSPVYSTSVKQATVTNGTTSFSWTDSWGNSGDGTMTFLDGWVNLKMNQTKTSSGQNRWSFSNISGGVDLPKLK